MSVLYNIIHRDPRRLDQVIPQAPARLTELVHKCLEKSPERRYQELREVEQELHAIDASKQLKQESLSSTAEIRPVASASRNPYLNRVMIRRKADFFGRKQEVRRIYARLNATPPGSVSIVGDRKIGKSSLLNHIYMRSNRQAFLEEPERTVMVFMDLQQDKDMTMENFVTALSSMAEMELRGRVDIKECSRDLDGIRVMVERLDVAGIRLAVLLDEFELITGNANFPLEFFSFLRFLANHYNVAYLTSSSRDLQGLCHDQVISDSPFFNIFSTMRLSVFRREEGIDLIRIPSEKAGRPLEPYAEKLLDIAGLFPFFLQMACSHTLEFMEEFPDSEPDFGRIRHRFYEEAQFHYRHMWQSFAADEKSAIYRVARGKKIPDALGHVLKDLSSRHYVETTDGSTNLFAGPFRDFVLTEARQERSFLGRLFKRS